MRRDWWIGVAAIVLAILIHALIPRYEWRQQDQVLIKIDRWTGDATRMFVRSIPVTDQ